MCCIRLENDRITQHLFEQQGMEMLDLVLFFCYLYADDLILNCPVVFV